MLRDYMLSVSSSCWMYATPVCRILDTIELSTSSTFLGDGKYFDFIVIKVEYCFA